MENFNIRNYIWNIYEISDFHNHADIRMALDMFIANLDFGYERYAGATGIDYEELSKQWLSKSKSYHIHQKLIFNKIINTVFGDLCDAWKLKDKNAFEKACFSCITMFGIEAVKPDN